jgi:flagellar motor switch protein FliN/FliY
MSLPDEFADAFAGLEAVPAPGTAAVEQSAAAPAEPAAPVAESPEPASQLDVTSVLPQPRPERVMGPAATDLPPLPRPDLPELGTGTASGEARDLRLLADVQVELAVEIGRVKLPLRDLLSLEPGSVLELDRSADAPVDVLVNGCLVARGEVVVIDGEFGVRITAVVER